MTSKSIQLLVLINWGDFNNILQLVENYNVYIRGIFILLTGRSGNN